MSQQIGLWVEVGRYKLGLIACVWVGGGWGWYGEFR